MEGVRLLILLLKYSIVDTSILIVICFFFFAKGFFLALVKSYSSRIITPPHKQKSTCQARQMPLTLTVRHDLSLSRSYPCNCYKYNIQQTLRKLPTYLLPDASLNLAGSILFSLLKASAPLEPLAPLHLVQNEKLLHNP